MLSMTSVIVYLPIEYIIKIGKKEKKMKKNQVFISFNFNFYISFIKEKKIIVYESIETYLAVYILINFF